VLQTPHKNREWAFGFRQIVLKMVNNDSPQSPKKWDRGRAAKPMDLSDANSDGQARAPIASPMAGARSGARSGISPLNEPDVGTTFSLAMDEFEPPITIVEPAIQAAPLVFSSPHSGRKYPADFRAASKLDDAAIRRSEDSYVDEIFVDAPSIGIPFLCAEFPRAFMDVNREAFEFDPDMFVDPLPGFINTKSHRVANGLGTIARVVSDGREIYKDKLTLADALERVDRLHIPYHQTLSTLMETTRTRFGSATLIDCHSMPSYLSGSGAGHGRGRQNAGIILGNRYGTSCSPLIVDTVESVLKASGYNVIRNEPFAGGYCTERWGRPISGFHSLQIEINRSLYMNETTMERGEGLSRLKEDMRKVIKSLAGLDTAPLKSPLEYVNQKVD
jgi:N-formylglutamate amidohydrolase